MAHVAYHTSHVTRGSRSSITKSMLRLAMTSACESCSSEPQPLQRVSQHNNSNKRQQHANFTAQPPRLTCSRDRPMHLVPVQQLNAWMRGGGGGRGEGVSNSGDACNERGGEVINSTWSQLGKAAAREAAAAAPARTVHSPRAGLPLRGRELYLCSSHQRLVSHDCKVVHVAARRTLQ